MKIAVCQMKCRDTKKQTLELVDKLASEAKSNHADILVLPEMFICPYEYDAFLQYAESEDDNIVYELRKISKKYSMYIFSGSIPEKKGDKIYNTMFVLDKSGEVLGKYSKKHLFDIDVKNSITFKESDYLSAGNDSLVVDIDGIKFGVAICFDIRFPSDFKAMRERGADVFIVPASFNMTTGPVHWDILLQSRALDNQCYLIACAGALEEKSSYHSYGHSSVVGPWGKILEQCEQEETVLYTDIDKAYIDTVRGQIPLNFE